MKGKQIDVCFPFFVDAWSLLLAKGRGQSRGRTIDSRGCKKTVLLQEIECQRRESQLPATCATSPEVTSALSDMSNCFSALTCNSRC